MCILIFYAPRLCRGDFAWKKKTPPYGGIFIFTVYMEERMRHEHNAQKNLTNHGKYGILFLTNEPRGTIP